MFGMTDNRVHDRLLCEKSLTLARTLEICRANEVSSAQQIAVNKINDNSVHGIGRGKHSKQREMEKNPGRGKSTGWISDCKFCEREHKKSKEACPAYGEKGANCNKLNHFKIKCPQSYKSHQQHVRGISNNVLHEESDSSESEVYRPDTVKTVSSIKLQDEQTVSLKIKPKCYIRFQIDNSADCNVLPLHVYKAATGDHCLMKVIPSETTVYAYGQIGTPSVGKVKTQEWRGNKTCNLMCELLEGEQFHSVLGSDACVFLGILEVKDNDKLNPVKEKGCMVHVVVKNHAPIAKKDFLKKYPSVFRDTVGKLGSSYKIRVEESVSPAQHAPRRVPAALRSQLKEELDCMEELGVIAKVTVATE